MNSTIDLVDPQLRPALENWPKLKLTAARLEKSRRFVVNAASSAPKPDIAGLSVNQVFVESAFGDPPVRILVYRPTATEKSSFRRSFMSTVADSYWAFPK